MATDVETGTQEGETAHARPSLKITGLHIRGLKSINSLDLPEDGLGWDGPIPDLVMLGGINGSGKTTLLEFLVGLFTQFETGRSDHQGPFVVNPELRASEAIIDFQYSLGAPKSFPVRIIIGSKEFVTENTTNSWMGLVYIEISNNEMVVRRGPLQPDVYLMVDLMQYGSPKYGQFISPNVVFFPSERRTLISPSTNHKFAGKLSDRLKFVDRWEPPEAWDKSLEARLYGVRWEDLNAKEEGRDQEANSFDAYSKAFDRFFEGRKRLKWHNAELVVETKGGAIHDLSELSSGEKQVILFMGELLHRWRPGSLILIDEPELHLHEYYQTKLWESLLHWQKERGGQVIVATQSAHLFGLSGLGTRVVLNGWS